MTANIAETPRDVASEVGVVADHLIGLWRSFDKARARLLAASEPDVEWWAHVALKCIADSGQPMRAAALAESLQSDPSTVSRQVATLVKEGYLERRADPADGRASLLALTPKALDLLVQHDRRRLEFFARVMDGWSAADLKRFAALLERFAKSYDTVHDEWMTHRIQNPPRRTGSPN